MTTFTARGPILATCFALMFLMTLVGCGESSSEGGKPKIALIMKSLANEFFSTMAEGARRHHEQHTDEYELIVNGIKDERDLSEQVNLVEQMIARGVDAIVIAPADSKALVPVLKRAQQAGIVVVNIDNKLDEKVQQQAGVDIPFVGPDNRAGAKLVGDYLAERLDQGDHVAVLEGIKSSFNGQQRQKGFEDAMNSAGAEIVDSQSAEWETNNANRIATAMISEHEDLKAILAANDSMALGALSAVKSAGKQGELLIVGFDNISAVQQAIRNGEILATADQHADQLAVFGIDYALQILDGGAPADKETPVDLVTAKTLSQ